MQVAVAGCCLGVSLLCALAAALRALRSESQPKARNTREVELSSPGPNSGKQARPSRGQAKAKGKARQSKAGQGRAGQGNTTRSKAQDGVLSLFCHSLAPRWALTRREIRAQRDRRDRDGVLSV